MSVDDARPVRRPASLPLRFWVYWLADALSNSGTVLAGLAVQLVVLEVLHAGASGAGVVRAASTLPLLVFGMAAGGVADGGSRIGILRRAAAWAAAGMASLAVLVWTGTGTLWVVAAVMFVVGVATTIQSAAHQAYIPDLVGDNLLHRANGLFSKGAQAAVIVGALVSGFAMRWVSAAVLLAVDAASYLAAWGACRWIATRTTLTLPAVGEQAGSRGDVLPTGTGWSFIRWMYAFPPLARYAWLLHVWFIGNGICATLFVSYAVVGLGAGAPVVGSALAVGGVAGIAGAHWSQALQNRLGVARSSALSWGLCGVGFVGLATAQLAGAASVPLLFVTQLFFGFGMGTKIPIELTYRNAVTPRLMRGRMHAFIRTANWGVFTAAAAASGYLSDWLGFGPVVLLGGVAMIVAAVGLHAVPMDHATAAPHGP